MSKRAELRVRWSRRERDYEVHYDRHKADGRWFVGFLRVMSEETRRQRRACGKPERFQFVPPPKGFAVEDDVDFAMLALRDELRDRGFDPDTLTISVRRFKETR